MNRGIKMPKYHCHRKECTHIRSEFSMFLNRRRPPRYEGYAFCSDSCLLAHFEDELRRKWQRLQRHKQQRIPRPKIGTILMHTAYITRDQLEEAIRLQSQTKEGRLGEWLLRLGFVEEHQITMALAKQYGLPMIQLRDSEVKNEAVKMIPGKVAKSSGFLPVGFNDDRDSLRVVVSAPVDFNAHEAIRRMVRKGIVAYIGDQSAIQRLLEQWYAPEDLDLTNIPTFSCLESLLKVGRDMVSAAINQKADNMQAELLPDFLWVRLDFPVKSHHHIFRYDSAAIRQQEQCPAKERPVGYAFGN
jgi:hypothetical protein